MSRLPPLANTHIDDSGMIHGDDFNDTYFSRENGLDESRLVFLQGCGLPQAWAGRSHFVIGELGFGTGLNVLATWDLWKKTRQDGAILHIITVEGFLLEAKQAKHAHENWPELKALSDQLIAQWPTRAYGAQRIWFPDDGLCITFLIGPCEDALSRMDFAADCWFLDGFAPSRNPQMWEEGVFAQIARLSAPGARLGTYSVAGVVKAGLRNVGFTLNRLPGFGSKRQRLEAHLGEEPNAIQKRPKTAIVIGGGIGGSSVAAALMRRGIAVDLFDDDYCARTKASGNPVALIMPRLDRADTREARFFRAAYLMALANYQQMGTAFDPSGIREVSLDAESAERLNNLASDPPLPPSHLAQPDVTSLMHLQGGLVFPDLVLKHLKTGATIHPVAIVAVEQHEGLWHACGPNGDVVAKADICVIANGPGAVAFSDVGDYMRGRAGQLSWSQVDRDLPTAPLSGGAYCAPFHDKLIFGATFEPIDLDGPTPQVTRTANVKNRDMLAGIAPELARTIDLDRASGRAAIRATTPDQLPIVGALTADGAGKFILCGLGSRGFTTAFLNAEIIASQACGEPCPVEAQVALALAPDRFAKRAAKRGKAKPN
jgi:tRNA 5-methylaminomethyl-2-thiouridine biosynthesis bifunctional protein